MLKSILYANALPGGFTLLQFDDRNPATRWAPDPVIDRVISPINGQKQTGNWGVILLLSGVGFPIYSWLFAHLVATITAVRAPTLPLLSHITFWALINMESSTTGGMKSSWCLNQPIWKICNRQIGSWNPKVPGEHENIFECHHLVIHKVHSTRPKETWFIINSSRFLASQPC